MATDKTLPLSFAATRPTRLDEATVHMSSETGEVSFGFVDSTGLTRWGNGSFSPGANVQNADLNSIVNGDISRQNCTKIYPAQIFRVGVNAGSIRSVDGTTNEDACFWNRDGAASAQGYRAERFVATGITSTFAVRAVLPAGVGSATIVIQILSQDGLTTLGTQACVLSSTATLFTVSAPTVVGTEYRWRGAVNDVAIGTSANAQALCSRIAITCTGVAATSVFAKPYVRVPMASNQAGNSYWSPQDRYDYSSSLARLPLTTSATTIVVEYYCNTVNPGFVDGAVFENGRPHTQIPAANATQLNQTTVTLSAGTKLVEVFSGPQSGQLSLFIVAVYIPASENVEVIRPAGGRTLVTMGDSIQLGSEVTPIWAAVRGMWSLLRNRYPGGVYFEAYGSWRLGVNGTFSFGYVSAAGTLSTAAGNVLIRTQLMQRLRHMQPTEVYIAIGTNDLTVAVAPADIEVGYAALLDDVHACIPGATIWLQSLLRRAAAFEAGSAPGYRAATLNVLAAADPNVVSPNNVAGANTRGRYATNIDGLPAVSAANFGSDQLHPNDEGYRQYADYVASFLAP